MTAAMICGDAEVTIGSTLSALVVPTASARTTNTVFVCSSAPRGVLDGVAMQRDSSRITRHYYENVTEIPSLTDLRKPVQLTFYFLTVDLTTRKVLDLRSLFSHPLFRDPKATHNIAGITIMFDDRNGLGKIGPHKLGYLDHMESLHGPSFLVDTFAHIRSKVRIIVAGSWYDAFGHQGGYVTGHADSVEALTWDAKAYFFSTPPMPLQACMTDKAIEMLQCTRDGKEEKA